MTVVGVVVTFSNVISTKKHSERIKSLAFNGENFSPSHVILSERNLSRFLQSKDLHVVERICRVLNKKVFLKIRKDFYLFLHNYPYTARFLTLRVHSDFPNPSGFPLRMTECRSFFVLHFYFLKSFL